MSAVTHLGPEDGTGWLNPADELEEIELGNRAGLWLTNWELAMLYSREQDRVYAGVGYMVAAVASATSRRQELDPGLPALPFPVTWWPPSAGKREV